MIASRRAGAVADGTAARTWFVIFPEPLILGSSASSVPLYTSDVPGFLKLYLVRHSAPKTHHARTKLSSRADRSTFPQHVVVCGDLCRTLTNKPSRPSILTSVHSQTEMAGQEWEPRYLPGKTAGASNRTRRTHWVISTIWGSTRDLRPSTPGGAWPERPRCITDHRVID